MRYGLKKCSMLLALFIAMSYFCIIPVHAASVDATGAGAEQSTNEDDLGAVNASETGFTIDRHDAVADIMTNERFTGAIDSISWLTERIDQYFVIIISVTAFFIISSALLKNVCAGAYCANHKFWDKVAQAHEKSEAISLASIGQYFQGKQFMQATPTSFKDMILGIIPNIKAWTDFDDADIEPKAYFMKAIPQMLGCVIIGVFIYNGYYRDAASTVGNFGSAICERVFSSVDPETFLDKLTNTTSTPDNIYKNDPTIQGDYCYKISMALYKVCVSKYQYETAEEKSNLMRACEIYANTIYTNDLPSEIKNGDDKKEFKISGVKVVLEPLMTGATGDTATASDAVPDKNGDYYIRVTKVTSETLNKAQPAHGFTEGETSIVFSASFKVTNATGSVQDSSVTPSDPTGLSSANLTVTIDYPAGGNIQNDKAAKSFKLDPTLVASTINSQVRARVQENLTDGAQINGNIKFGNGTNAPTVKKGDVVGTTYQWGEAVKVPIRTGEGSSSEVRVTIVFRLAK